MTTVFKSDVKATAKIGISSGYKGAADWAVYADFSSNDYRDRSGVIQLTDVITSPAQVSYLTIIDKNGNTELSPAGVPRRSFVPAHGVFAVLAETPNAGRVAGSNVVITNNAATVYALYATKGKVSIDTTKVNVLAGSGTSADPILFKYKDSTTIAISKDRFDALAICVACVGNRAPLGIIQQQFNLTDADLLVNLSKINKTQFTIVLRTISPKIGAGVLGNASGFVPIVKFIQDATVDLSYVKVRNTSLNIKRNSGGTNAVANEAAPVTQVVDTYAISIDNGKISHYMNGAKIKTIPTLNMSSFVLNELKVLSSDMSWGVPKNSDALINLIMYDRVLTAQELASCVFE